VERTSVNDPEYRNDRSIHGLSVHRLHEIQQFFQVYKVKFAGQGTEKK
jgi:inorganic pyrophosphatase